MCIILHNWQCTIIKHFRLLIKDKGVVSEMSSPPIPPNTHIVQLKLGQAKSTLITPSENETGLLLKISMPLVQAVKKLTKQCWGFTCTRQFWNRTINFDCLDLIISPYPPSPLVFRSPSHLILKSQGFCCWFQTKQIKLKTQQPKYIVDRVTLNYPTAL